MQARVVGTLVFGGAGATITSWTDTAIVAVVPNGVSGASVAQVYQNNASSNQYPIKIGSIIVPAISGLSLSQGPPQMGFVITGANFGVIQGTSSATVGGFPLIVQSWSSTSILVEIPVGATGTGVVVTVGGAPSFPAVFTVVAPFACAVP